MGVGSATTVSGRLGFAFSADGSSAISLWAGETVTLEQWALTGRDAVSRRLPEIPVDHETHVLPLDDATVLVAKRRGGPTSRRHEITVVAPGEAHAGSEGTSLSRTVGEIEALGGYLLPCPRWLGTGLFVALDTAEHSTIWRLSGTGATRVVRLTGVVSGGTWLDGDNGLLAVNHGDNGRSRSGIVIDIPSGSCRRVWSVSETSKDRILHCGAAGRLLVVSGDSSGEQRIGLARLGEPDVRFPDTLHRPGFRREALAVDERGERLLVHETSGAVSRLFVYTPEADRLSPLDIPAGTVSPPVSWRGGRIRIPFSAPARPPTLATIELAEQPSWSLPSEPGERLAPVRAELVEVPGAAGPIEAIAYGGPDWYYRENLVVALHGGPVSQWSFEFDPLLHSLAAAGIAVLAPNYRGSTGYGRDHLRAAIGDWGGPDLDDVGAIGEALAARRARRGLDPPVVLGASYGAFLALLAACTEHRTWSGCVALAPFLSASSLRAAAGTAVRDRVTDLAGSATVDRDVLRACPALATPLLLAHGARDEKIPVHQSRTLHARLRQLGKTSRGDVEYLELDSDHSGVAAATAATLRHRIVSFCLAHRDTVAEPGRRNRTLTDAGRR